jgi:methylthioribose-1-phosphate isomerase
MRIDASSYQGLRPVVFGEGGKSLHLLDQRQLPGAEVWLDLQEIEDVAHAIEDLAVRGAPAIGCAAAIGLAAAAYGFSDDPSQFRSEVEAGLDRLSKTRPTAVNLFVAIEQLRAVMAAQPETADVTTMRAALSTAAQAHVDADVEMCLRIGEHGAPLMPDEGNVLTHCNTGALATAGFGTALGVIRRARALGKKFSVFADETRPVLQGARLTAWELWRENIPVKVIADNMAGALMAQGEVQAAIVGADRIARNGDVANKIGTYSVAVLCRYHSIPFYVAAPWTTIDLSLASGREIPIEERDPEEIRRHGGRLMTPADIPVRNPAFDVTPAALIDGIVTDRGVFRPDEIAAGG